MLLVAHNYKPEVPKQGEDLFDLPSSSVKAMVSVTLGTLSSVLSEALSNQ